MTNDVFAADPEAQAGPVGPLHTITVVTGNLEAMHRFLHSGIGLSAGPVEMPSTAARERASCYLGIPESRVWRAQSYTRPTDESWPASQVRVIAIDEPGDVIRPEVNGRYVGGLSIGFAMLDLDAREAVMQSAGFESSVGVKSLEFAKPDGTRYVSQEIHFIGPEQILGLGVKRPDGFQPVGPLDPRTGVSGPAYSAQCVPDADAAAAFYRDVLGYEIRRDVDLTVAQPSGLRLRTGMKERFVQAFAPASSTGYLVLLDHYDENVASPAAHLGPPSRGVAMWSFPARDLTEVMRRAQAAGSPILASPARYDSPCLGSRLSMMLASPSGFPVEVFEHPDSGD